MHIMYVSEIRAKKNVRFKKNSNKSSSSLFGLLLGGKQHQGKLLTVCRNILIPLFPTSCFTSPLLYPLNL